MQTLQRNDQFGYFQTQKRKTTSELKGSVDISFVILLPQKILRVLKVFIYQVHEQSSNTKSITSSFSKRCSACQEVRVINWFELLGLYVGKHSNVFSSMKSKINFPILTNFILGCSLKCNTHVNKNKTGFMQCSTVHLNDEK